MPNPQLAWLYYESQRRAGKIRILSPHAHHCTSHSLSSSLGKCVEMPSISDAETVERIWAEMIPSLDA